MDKSNINWFNESRNMDVRMFCINIAANISHKGGTTADEIIHDANILHEFVVAAIIPKEC